MNTIRLTITSLDTGEIWTEDFKHGDDAYDWIAAQDTSDLREIWSVEWTWLTPQNQKGYSVLKG